nr:ABC transporter substrate-binding protein [uncultured Desulfobacter sp.]
MRCHISFLQMLVLLTILFPGTYALGEVQPIKIGFIGDFSSVTKAYTQNSFKAAQLAINQFNDQGGLLGRPVQMLQRDGGNNPDDHYHLVKKLVREKKISAVFGGGASPCVLKASVACREEQVPYLVSIGNTQSIVVEKGHPYVFLFEPNSHMESMGFSIFASLMPWQRYAWIGPDYIWGRDVMGFFKQYFTKIGAPVTWTAEIWHPLGTRDYTEAIKQLMDGKPEALVVATWGEDLFHFVNQAKSRKLFDTMAAFGWFSVMTDENERLLPEGIWKISRAPFHYLSQKYSQTHTFVKQLRQKFRVFPVDFAICCYDSFLAWKEAVIKAGSPEPHDVARMLKGLSFTGLRGESSIRALDGQLNCPAYFGRLTYLDDYPVAIIESVMEIPAAKTWLSKEEILIKRKK